MTGSYITRTDSGNLGILWQIRLEGESIRTTCASTSPTYSLVSWGPPALRLSTLISQLSLSLSLVLGELAQHIFFHSFEICLVAFYIFLVRLCNSPRPSSLLLLLSFLQHCSKPIRYLGEIQHCAGYPPKPTTTAT